MKIAIIGAGAFGTALGGILFDNGFEIDYYDPNLAKIRLSDALDNASFCLVAAPSIVVPYLLPHLPRSLHLIVATKGLFDDRLLLKFDEYDVISGPTFADDIKNKRLTKMTATSKDVVDMFATDYLSFDITNDKKGVLMCGSLKNIYAMYAGFLGLKRETKSWREYISKVLTEMRRILLKNEALPETVDLACGVYDLMLTSGLPSRNYEYGLRLAKNHNHKSNNTVEGLTALNKIKHGRIKIPKDAVIMHNCLKKL